MPAKTRKRFFTRFDAKTGRNVSEDQKQRSLPYFDVMFVGILDSDQTKLRKTELVSCKISSTKGFGSPDLNAISNLFGVLSANLSPDRATSVSKLLG